MVELWDVGGERHAAHAAARRGALYDRGFAGVLLVWDARRPRTRHALRGWAADLARHASFDRGGAFHPAAAGGGGSSSVGAAGISAADGQGDADCELEAMLAGDMPSEPSSPRYVGREAAEAARSRYLLRGCFPCERGELVPWQ